MSSSEDGYRIGAVARMTGIPGRRIRFYEERGLVFPASRSESGYRLYGEREVARLHFVKRAKTLGLTLAEIRDLVSVADGCSTSDIAHHLESVLDEKLRQTRRSISELAALEANLVRFRSRAVALERGEITSTCDSGEPVGFCGCLEALTENGEPGEEVEMDNVENTPCTCSCECCADDGQACTCSCDCCAECA